MSSRESILQAIKKNKPEPKPLPAISMPSISGIDLVEQYKTSLEKNGGKFYPCESLSSVDNHVQKDFPRAGKICSLVEGVKGKCSVTSSDDPHSLYDIDVAIVGGSIAVAENAAIWLGEENLIQRALPFIAQHLVIVVYKKDLIGNMHEAYQRIKLRADGYGVFIFVLLLNFKTYRRAILNRWLQ